MKVIVASFPKCGTKTLHRALEILGYSVHDFDSHVFIYSKQWLKILKYGSEANEFKSMYENVDAICDQPAFFYWEEMSEAFPEAKIILTMRSDEDEWYKSYQNHLGRVGNVLTKAKLNLTPTGRRALSVWKQMSYVIHSCPPQQYLGCLRNPNAQVQKRRYREHNDGVLKRAVKDKLLVFNLSDGWKPLCQFLGRDVPDVPFPHENVKGALAESSINLPLFKQMGKEIRVVISMLVFLIAIFCFFVFKSI